MKSLLLTLFCAVALFGQQTVTRIVHLKHIQTDNVKVVVGMIAAGKVDWQPDPRMRLIGLSGPVELVNAVEEAIKKLDVPPPPERNVELTFHILAAGGQAPSSPIPAELNGVVQQLGGVFGLKSFRLLETAVMRGREGRGVESSGVIAIPVKVEASPRYFLRVAKVSASAGDKGSLVRIDGLDFSVSVPTAKVGGQGLDWLGTGLKTDIDVREGQKVVVGKSSLDNSNQSIFLVVTAKMLD